MRPQSGSEVSAGKRCVVVADAASARVLLAENGPGGKIMLVEHARLENPDYLARGAEAPFAKTERNTDREAGPVHPQFEQHTRHRMEIERRFAAEVARQIAATVEDWASGSVVLAAEPGMLGLLRELAQDALPRGITLKSLARNYVNLTPHELVLRLDLR